MPSSPSPRYHSLRSVKSLATEEFHALDTDGSGTLTLDEIRAGLRQKGLPCSEDVLERFMRQADTNGDGHITVHEFVRFSQEREEAVIASYAAIDSRGDGRLTRDGLRHGAQALGFKIANEQLRTLIECADTDNDGVRRVLSNLSLSTTP